MYVNSRIEKKPVYFEGWMQNMSKCFWLNK